MRTIAVYPGRFQPFGLNHLGAYNWLKEKFGEENTYIVTSNITNNSDCPFNFEEKKQIILQNGIPEDKIVQVKNPYKAEELIMQFDPDNTVVVFMLGEKDAERIRPTKKDGSPGYFQKWEISTLSIWIDKVPLSKHGYFLTSPTEYIYQDYGKISGTDMRTLIPKNNAEYFENLMGWYNLELFEMMKTRLSNLNK